jgi:hypothetical protein
MRRLLFGFVLLLAGCSSANRITTDADVNTTEAGAYTSSSTSTSAADVTTTTTTSSSAESLQRSGNSSTTTGTTTGTPHIVETPMGSSTTVIPTGVNIPFTFYERHVQLERQPGSSKPSYGRVSPVITEKLEASPNPPSNDDGFLNFPLRAVMKQGKPKTLIIQIGLADIAGKLAAIAAGLRMTKEPMKVTRAMKVDLEYDKAWFDVQLQSPPTQGVKTEVAAAQRQPGEWRYSVTPLKHGTGQHLTLKVYAVMSDGVPQPVLVKTQTIDVDINVGYIAAQQWPWAGGLVAALIGVVPFKRWRAHRRQSTLVPRTEWMKSGHNETNH